MADFPIQVRVSEYDTEHGHRVHAKRGYVLCEFTALPILCDAFVDTAAPFSVVPYTISRHLSWNQLAKTLTSARTGAVAPLTWQAIPCDLGAITVRLIHPATGVRSNVLSLVAKLPQRAASPALERALVLGLALFDDNDVELVLQQRSGKVSGRLVTP